MLSVSMYSYIILIVTCFWLTVTYFFFFSTLLVLLLPYTSLGALKDPCPRIGRQCHPAATWVLMTSKSAS